MAGIGVPIVGAAAVMMQTRGWMIFIEKQKALERFLFSSRQNQYKREYS